MPGPTQGRTDYFRFTRIPPGVKQALARYELTGNNTIGILSFRIDADYKDPLAAGRFQPFDVVYRWKENGQAKTSRTAITGLPFSYVIQAAADPELISVACEMLAR